MTLAALLATVPPPASPLAPQQGWDDVRGSMDVTLAGDAIEVIEAYGQGRFANGAFMLDPRRPHDYLLCTEGTVEPLDDPDLGYAPFPVWRPGQARPGLLPLLDRDGEMLFAVVEAGEQHPAWYWSGQIRYREWAEVDAELASLLLGTATCGGPPSMGRPDRWRATAPFTPVAARIGAGRPPWWTS